MVWSCGLSSCGAELVASKGAGGVHDGGCTFDACVWAYGLVVERELVTSARICNAESVLISTLCARDGAGDHFVLG